METFTEPTVGNTRILESLLCLKMIFFAKETGSYQTEYFPPNKIKLTLPFVTYVDSIKKNSEYYKSMSGYNSLDLS